MSSFPSTRFSPAIDPKPRTAWNGFVKLRLGHSKKGSVFVVDHIFLGASAGWLFLQPSFFGPPSIAFGARPSDHRADFSVDVASPSGRSAIRLIVRIKPAGLRKTYPDGAQLYWCSIDGPNDISSFAAGTARKMGGDFSIRLQHHTNDAGYAGIMASRHFRCSDWNLQGNRKMVNVKHVYFTSLPAIVSDDDLARIAMARAGRLHFQTTEELGSRILGMEVYRGDTTGRTKVIGVDVPVELLAPPHLYFHPPVGATPAYYEVIGPEILRVAMAPGAILPFDGSSVAPVPADLKSFNYVVLGHAGTLPGLAAPYDEEATDEVMFIEGLPPDTDVFRFWKAHANSDLVTGRRKELRQLEPM